VIIKYFKDNNMLGKKTVVPLKVIYGGLDPFDINVGDKTACKDGLAFRDSSVMMQIVVMRCVCNCPCTLP
jgi:hypothetical protein